MNVVEVSADSVGNVGKRHGGLVVVVSTDRKGRVVGNVAGTEFESERHTLKKSKSISIGSREPNRTKLRKERERLTRISQSLNFHPGVYPSLKSAFALIPAATNSLSNFKHAS